MKIFYREIYSNSFYCKYAVPKRSSITQLARNILLRSDFIPNEELIEKGKRNKIEFVKNEFRSRESEWIAKLEEKILTILKIIINMQKIINLYLDL